MKILQYILIIATFVIAGVSCTDDFDQMNQNSLKAKTLDSKYVFTNSQLVYGAYRFSEFRSNIILASPFSGLSNSIYSVGRGFKNNNEYNGSKWGQAYKGEIKSIVDVLFILGDKPENANLIASARVMKVFYHLRLTDLYGDIPYFTSGKAYLDKVNTPAYDSQEVIYKDFVKELTEANAQFDAANTLTYGVNDLLFGGDVAKWKKFANSLKLRIGMRMTKVDAALAESTVKEAIAAGVMTEAADQAMVKTIVSGGEWGIHQNGASNGYRAENGRQFPSKDLITMMKDSKDPRMFVYFAKCFLNPAKGYMPSIIAPKAGFDPFAKEISNTGAFNDSVYYKGYESGAAANITTEYFVKTDTVTPGTFVYHKVKWNPHTTKSDDSNIKNIYAYLNPETIMSATAPVIYMSYSEVEFLLAEASHRGWAGTAAQDHYEKGIREAMKMAREAFPGQSSANTAMVAAGNFDYAAGVDAYVVSPSIKWDAAKGLELIATEKWKTFIANGYEAFAEVRRTGFPTAIKDVVASTANRPVYLYDAATDKVDLSAKIEDKELEVFTGSDTEGVRPRRFTYPNNESSLNKLSYNDAISLLEFGNDYRSRMWWDAK